MDRSLSEVLYVPYLLPIYFSIFLPCFTAKVTLLAVTEDVHDLSSAVLCPLIKRPSFLPGGTQKESWIPSPPSTCQFPPKRSKALHQGAAKTKPGPFTKETPERVFSHYTNDLLLLRAKGFKKTGQLHVKEPALD